MECHAGAVARYAMQHHEGNGAQKSKQNWPWMFAGQTTKRWRGDGNHINGGKRAEISTNKSQIQQSTSKKGNAVLTAQHRKFEKSNKRHEAWDVLLHCLSKLDCRPHS